MKSVLHDDIAKVGREKISMVADFARFVRYYCRTNYLLSEIGRADIDRRSGSTLSFKSGERQREE